MIRFEHDFIIVLHMSEENYILCKAVFEAKVIDPDSLQNCIVENSFWKKLHTQQETYTSVEEAQMWAVIQGLIEDGTHIPTLSTEALKHFTYNTRIFPINADTAKKAIENRLDYLDMFKVIS